ncbi:MAG: hypothetical protein ACRCXX_14415 [Cetobacterium sp.]|uniref:hypothetical protein n=1 Tax=Cetobacterium sp. TaxID=2071632 RepID=UPI003F392A54
METWQIIEAVFKKPINTIIDVATGKWLCNVCDDKKKFWSREAVLKAAKEKGEKK